MEKKLLPFQRPYMGPLVLVLLLNICSLALATVQPLFGRFVIDEVFLRRTFPFSQAMGLAVLLMACALGISLLTKFCYVKMSLRMMLDLRTAFYRHVLRLPYSFYAGKRVGDVISRVNEDLAETQRLYTDSLLQCVSISLAFLLNVGFLLLLDWKMTLVCFLLLPLLIWGTQKFRDTLFASNMALRELAAGNQSFLYDTLASVRFIRASNLQPWLEARYRDELTKLNEQSLKVTLIGACAQGVPQVVVLVSTIGIIWLLGFKVLGGGMSLGTLLAFTAYQASLYASVQGFAQLYIRLQKGRVAVRRVREFLGLPLERDGSRKLSSPGLLIRFEQVSFWHEATKPIFQQLDFCLAKGEMIGITGESGAGKSTLADLLARVTQPTAGVITIDGIDIQAIKRDCWNRKVCLVAHDHPVWYGSIAECLKLGGQEIDEWQMQAVLEDVGLWQDIEQMPQRLQTQVGEKGVRLSAGQKQRLLLAHALLRDPDVLILDEATCHLDAESECRLFAQIRERLKHKTVIIITHRLQNIMWVDRLLHVAEGKIRPHDQAQGGDQHGSVTLLHG
ncbi:ABC transporter ATP-binding protein [Brevibacillus massiliensis]|uniref:ABC transporter ATP-binding protein n=1 Tax=Brevibacillus massiliensis TaxID=1118054 RepID=UPI0002F0B08F|nr:ABC transporter ATP-binding protein [Brevibacillus massiliensis]